MTLFYSAGEELSITLTNLDFVVIINIMLAGLLKGLRDLIYPKTCLACKSRILEQEKQDFICLSCQNSIEKNLPPFCVSCGRGLEKKALNKSAKARSRATAYSYLSMVDRVIKTHKTWAECEKRVKGQSGAKYKKALSEIEEKEIIKSWETR